MQPERQPMRLREKMSAVENLRTGSFMLLVYTIRCRTHKPRELTHDERSINRPLVKVRIKFKLIHGVAINPLNWNDTSGTDRHFSSSRKCINGPNRIGRSLA